MSAKHTPGPWRVETDGIPELRNVSTFVVAGDRLDWVLVCDVNTSPDDARLIAAAPELLGLLAEGVGLQARHHGDGTGLHIAMIAWAGRARAAIARATGEQG